MRLVFDRGTILLVAPPPDLALAAIPGVLWDPRVAAFRAPAYLHPRLVAHLAGRGVGLVDAVRPRGAHVLVRCGECTTVVPVHTGEDLTRGTLRALERQLEPCRGKGWLQRCGRTGPERPRRQ